MVFRVHKNKNYTIMSNCHLKDKRLSLKAKGLLSIMLSLPDDWDYSIEGLISLSDDGKKAVSSALKELKEYKYLSIDKKFPNKDSSNRIEYIYNIFENPTESQDPHFVDLQKVDLQKVDLQKGGQLNTNNTITKELNTNNNIYSQIIDYLNVKAKTHYRLSNKAKALLQARINEFPNNPYSFEDFKKVIDKKCADWLGSDYEQYLRPETLFSNKFESYLNSNVTKHNYNSQKVEERHYGTK